jgi:hypothetical protein
VMSTAATDGQAEMRQGMGREQCDYRMCREHCDKECAGDKANMNGSGSNRARNGQGAIWIGMGKDWAENNTARNGPEQGG